MNDVKGAVPPYQEQPHFVQPGSQAQSFQGGQQQIAPVQHQQSFQGQQQPMQQPYQQQQEKGMQQPQAGMAPPQNTYANSTPLQSLQSSPMPVDCPMCRHRQMTRIEFHSGNTTFAWAAGICCVIGLGCIPFCITSLKDVSHFCGSCGCKLATWHRSGRVEVHAHN